MLDETFVSLASIAGVAFAYWLFLEPIPRPTRIFALAPAALYVAGFVYALAFAPITANLELRQLRPFLWPYHFFYVAGVLVAVWVPMRLRTKIWPHIAQLLLIPPALMLWFLGGMTLAHDSL